MNGGEQFSNRVWEAIAMVVVTLIATVGGRMIDSMSQAITDPEPTTEFSLSLFSGLLNSLPGIFTLIGIMGATLVGGPFGFIGAILETVGSTKLLFNQNEAGLWIILVGAALVTLGRFIPRPTVFELLLNSGNRRY